MKDKIFKVAYDRNDIAMAQVEITDDVAQIERDNKALIKIVAQSSHEEHCYAENWWDSSCDCGLMDLVLQLSPHQQNDIDYERKSWEESEGIEP